MVVRTRPLTRVSGWRSQLLAWGEAQRYRKFAWGETDCASLVREGLGVVFGHPVMVLNYATRSEAKSTMRDIVKTASSYLEEHGASRIAVSEMQGGEVVVMPGLINKMPRLAFAIDHDVLLTSTPHSGPVWMSKGDLALHALVYRFGR